ncbi:hypothetical protein HOI18_01475 [Candidatus Uhrbacteria bacterium]|mgnify:FL=1|nr:hypothetical protein [Candidatus Uhrbacteria bacterium]
MRFLLCLAIGLMGTAQAADYPGRHMFTSHWINDTASIEQSLRQTPWTERCELRRSTSHTGFSLRAKVDEKGQLVDPKVVVFTIIGTSTDDDLLACVLKQARALEPLSVEDGFTPGYEGAGDFTYQYFLP